MTAIPVGELLYWIGQGAVAMMAAAGVLEAGKKRFDLFGMVVVALAAALGGGTVRDLLLGRPVFWVADQTYLIGAAAAALVTFFLARVLTLRPGFFLIPDAAGLALFTVVGTKAALLMEAPWLVASLMGLITGVIGGVLRDLLCNEEPLVFQGSLYATASWLGALLLIALSMLGVDDRLGAVAAGLAVFLVRLAAIRWDIGLPKFRAKGT